jgi:hypothetical protein
MSFWIWVAVLVFVLWLIGAANKAKQSKCPSCQKWSAMIYQDRRETARKQGYAMVSRTDFYNSSNDSGTIEREERALVVRVTYSNRLRCRHCGHQLCTTTTQQYEPDFAEVQRSRSRYDDGDDGNDWHNDSF